MIAWLNIHWDYFLGTLSWFVSTSDRLSPWKHHQYRNRIRCLYNIAQRLKFTRRWNCLLVALEQKEPVIAPWMHLIIVMMHTRSDRYVTNNFVTNNLHMFGLWQFLKSHRSRDLQFFFKPQFHSQYPFFSYEDPKNMQRNVFLSTFRRFIFQYVRNLEH